MRTAIVRAKRDRGTKPDEDRPPDSVSGPISGGSMKPIDPMEILGRGGPAVRPGGAISGATQTIPRSPKARAAKDRGVGLSDGSRIVFASFADIAVFADE
jgi:hypothetical protein